MKSPEIQRLKNEMTISQGNNFLDLIAIQYQMKDLDTSQRMILGLAMQKTFNQIKQAKNQLKTLN